MSRIEFDMPELPESWSWESLGSVTQRVPNAKPELEPDRAFRYIDISSIDNKNHIIVETRSFMGKEAPSRAKRPVRTGDVLLSNVRINLRNTALVTDQTSADLCSTGFTLLRANGKMLPEFMFRYVLSDQFVRPLEELQTGTQYPATSDRIVFEQPIPVPPLDQQELIIKKVEDLLDRVSASRERLTTISTLLRKFRQSVLAAACSGQLTADWRERNPGGEMTGGRLVTALELAHEEAGGHRRGNAAAPSEDAHDLTKEDLPETWGLTDFKNAVMPERPITYGILKPGPEIEDGIPYIRVADFPGDNLRTTNIKRTSRAIEAQYARARLNAGDVLLSIRGTVGRVCIVPDSLQDANITQDTARLSLQPLLNRDYVVRFLQSFPVQHRMEAAQKGVAVRGINIGDVRALQLAVPPPDEQAEIVRRVDSLFALADSIESRLADATAQVERTTQAILAKAFRGELETSR